MRPSRLRGFTYTGCRRYFLTICTFQRRPHFRQPRVVTDIWSTFLRTAGEQKFVVIAYCFMPDHLHLLVEGYGESADVQTFVAAAKQRSAYVVRRSVTGRLWQPGYFDRVLRAEDDVHDVARYIIQNPVRGGLVQTIFEYPYWGSAVLARHELAESTMWTPGAP